MQPLKKTTKTPFVRKPHSIRLVEIPPTGNSGRGIKLSVETAGCHPHPLPTEAHCPGLRISELVSDISSVYTYFSQNVNLFLFHKYNEIAKFRSRNT